MGSPVVGKFRLVQFTFRGYEPQSAGDWFHLLWGMDVFAGPIPLLKLTVVMAWAGAYFIG